jgi:hypothetical protein
LLCSQLRHHLPRLTQVAQINPSRESYSAGFSRHCKC